jgi:membrane-associated phospholipid phosphatase
VRSFFRYVAVLAGAHWKLKLRFQIGLALFFCACYFTLQHIAIVPVHTFSPNALDLMIHFDPRWVWVYQSAYLLLTIIPWLADSRLELQRYARGFVLLSCVGFAFFLFWPVAGPRPVEIPADTLYRFLLRYDRATNAFPSLHVGLTTYTVLFGVRTSRGRLPSGARVAFIAIAVAWCAAIDYATIATKQHFAVDVPAGALLAWVCHHWTWSGAPNRQRRIAHAEAATDRVDMHWDPVSVLERGLGLPPTGTIAGRGRK